MENLNNIVIRKATENDRSNISKTITYSFKKIMSVFTKDMDKMAKVFENGIDINRFFVAEQESEIIGIVACGDCNGRPLKSTKEECRKYLGFIKGSAAFNVIKSKLMRPHKYPETTGYIDVIGVLEKARGKGVANKLLYEIISNNPKYKEFILDVDNINKSAINSYKKFGFVEYKFVPVIKFIKRGKIFMKYTVKF